MPPLTVLISNAFEPHHLQLLHERFPDVHFVELAPDGMVPQEGREAEILLRGAMSKAELSRTMQNAPQVRWIHTSTAGFDWVLVPEVEERGVLITRSPASKAVPIAEFVVAFIFLMAKRFPTLARAQIKHEWIRSDTDEVRGRTVGIVGAGAIGCEVARLCSHLGMHVIGSKRKPVSLPYFDQVLAPDDLPQLLSRADYVVITCPLTSETEGLIGAPELRTMKKTAYLINVARGGIVVENDLIQGLHEEWIAGACLDVFHEEPLPPDSPLWDIKNVIITPHASWGSPRSMDYVLDEFMENLKRRLAGQELLNQPKNPALGY
ncbi:MAG: D-2-hydroxyacid dehydrogenase [Caldilineaceae bacterium]|nr:D-2-hydroxyacid dehydrogenase [Caldilineaceae bacterium]MCB9138707.1 D-2-hydroxyacid dehydrogenase [Caldilineaceae bacterium]